MSRRHLFLAVSLLFSFLIAVQAPLVAVQAPAVESRVKDFIPAGTILHCTMDEPNFSPKTANVGDPVLCHLGPLGSFGHSIFPRGAELGGHLQDYKNPGHFVGKGWMAIEFDRLILPNAEVYPLAAKVINAPHLNVDAQGDMHGKGHPKRDAFFWAMPLFWPVKVFTLPARGPYPALKGESRLSLRLMEDVEVPFPTTAQNSVPMPPWSSSRRNDYRSMPSEYQAFSNVPQQTPAVQRITSVSAEAANGTSTIIALQAGTAILAREYWLEGDKVACVFASGERQDVPLNAIDLAQTVKVNQERNVEFALHTRRAVEQ
jgi:hypothetical protein